MIENCLHFGHALGKQIINKQPPPPPLAATSVRAKRQNNNPETEHNRRKKLTSLSKLSLRNPRKKTTQAQSNRRKRTKEKQGKATENPTHQLTPTQTFNNFETSKLRNFRSTFTPAPARLPAHKNVEAFAKTREIVAFLYDGLANSKTI